jgi:hypothetical protein
VWNIPHSGVISLRLGQRFATTAAQTNALLDEYIKMMARSEQIAGIVFDEQWQGAEHVRPLSLPSLHPLTLAIAGRGDH